MRSDRDRNKNVLYHARRSADVSALERRDRVFKIFYLIAFVYTLIIDLAYVLGSALLLDEEGETSAAGELWLVATLTLVLVAAAVCFIKRRDIAGLVLTVITCGVQFFIFLALAGFTSAFIARHAVPLSLLLVFSIILFAVRAKTNARVTAEYDRITGALYRAASKDGAPTAEELERIFDAFDGNLPTPDRPLKRSVKKRMEKENR